jgi:hypothetical protein
MIISIRKCIQKFPDWIITKYTLTKINTRWEAKQRVMVAKLTRLTHKIAIQLHLVAESSYRSRRPVRKLLDTPSYWLDYGLDDWNSFHCVGWKFISSLPRPDRLWGPTKSPIQWTAWALPVWVKRPGREADQSSTSNAEVKITWSYTPTPHNFSWRGT